MPSVVRQGLQHFCRLSLLGFAGYLFYLQELVWCLIVLAGTFPFWEGLQFLVWPLRPNWRGQRWLFPARQWLPVTYHHTTHTFTLHFPDPTNIRATCRNVYGQLKNFHGFNGHFNWVARRRGIMRRGVRYIYFDSLSTLR
jgi:hypothetical protein